jgi:hypothetical protein
MTEVYSVDDLYEIAAQEANLIDVDMYLDLVFSNQLNKYFNYDYNPKLDEVTFNFEIDEGSASLKINQLSWQPIVSYNDILQEHLMRRDI